MISDRVFKIGSAVKGDLTRIKKQFDQLANQTSFTVIDLKDYVLRRGILQRKESGSLEALIAKVLGMYLSKDDVLRKNDEWEELPLKPELLHYAALDVLASQLVFEEATKVAPLDQVEIDTPGGTQVSLLTQEGGSIIAYGRIASLQPTSLGGVRVNVPTRSRLVVDIDVVVVPSAAVILHILPQSMSTSSQKTKAGAYTLGQLLAASSGPTFQIVTPVTLLAFNHHNVVSISEYVFDHKIYIFSHQNSPSLSSPLMQAAGQVQLPSNNLVDIASQELSSDSEESSLDEGEADDNIVEMKMLEAHTESTTRQKGIFYVILPAIFYLIILGKVKDANRMLFKMSQLQHLLTHVQFFMK